MNIKILTGSILLFFTHFASAQSKNGEVFSSAEMLQAKNVLSSGLDFESKLFANEILQGAPHVLPELQGELKELVSLKAEVVSGWIKAGKIADIDPMHLFFSIWATTQHYADFDIQVRAVLAPEKDPFATAAPFLDNMYRQLLSPAS